MIKNANVVIIGGGIIGASIAYFLSKKIDNVVLLDKRNIASEASGANYGMVWQQTRQPGYDHLMSKRTIELYHYLIENVFDIDIEYEYKGGLTVYTTEIQHKAASGYVKSKQDSGIPVKHLDRVETRYLEPEISEKVVGSIYCAEEAQLNPINTTRAFIKAAKKEGATIYEDTEVTGINVEKNCIESVTTKKGKIKTNLIVNAAGCWASEIGDMVGLKIPVFPHRLQSVVTEKMPRLLNRIVQGSRVAETPEEAAKTFQYAYDASKGERPKINQEPPEENFVETALPFAKPTKSNNLVLGLTSDFVGFNRKTDYKAISLIALKAIELIPRLKDANVIRAWSSFDPWTVDGIPIVGETSIKGFLLAAGHGTGLSHGPATGESLAALISGEEPPVPLEAAKLGRYI